jgi:hypothetical protein
MLREEHRLRVFETRVLKRIFGPKRDEVTGEWRKLRSGELRNLYSSPNITRQIKSRTVRWAGHVARMGGERKVYKNSVGKPEGKNDRSEDRGVDGRMGSKWILGRLAGREGVECLHLAQDRGLRRAVVNTVTNFRVLASRI